MLMGIITAQFFNCHCVVESAVLSFISMLFVYVQCVCVLSGEYCALYM